MRDFYSLGPKELTGLAAILALQIAEETNANQQNVFGNFIVAVGSILLTIAAQDQLITSRSTPTSPSNDSSNDSSKDSTCASN